MGMPGLSAVRVKALFTVSEPIEVPGFTPKLVKSLIIRSDESLKGVIKKLLLSGGANKPLGITPVMSDLKPLLSDSPIRLIPGRTYWVAVGVVGGDDLITYLPEVMFKAFGEGVTEGLSVEVSVKDLSRPPQSLIKSFSIKTLTPAVIITKVEGGDSLLVNSPTLKELLASPIRVYGRVLWESQGINIPTAWAWRVARYYTQVTSHSRPHSVLVGNGRRVKGVMGYWRFVMVRRPPSYLHAVLSKALAIAESIGIGKSRGIGFGQVITELSSD